MKINDLIEFEGNYFLILSNPFILEGKNEHSNLQVIKVVDLANQTIDLLKIGNDQTLSKVDWVYISVCQVLSESFIREFQNKVHWSSVSRDQALTESFIREFQNKVWWSEILQNENISNEIKEKFRLEGKF